MLHIDNEDIKNRLEDVLTLIGISIDTQKNQHNSYTIELDEASQKITEIMEEL